ncbi:MULTISPECIES: serine/threonine-protein kinase [Actinoplanes]|uniref:serine/threonine-protein kinase n=1 Tax=Actinoplanes TaxID=1865 RepID=UPI0005F2C94C|nr:MULTISPECIES: serine/threonine-protein kinase [Actinoplanes]GLY06242.1 hypothetical protein Acsp01_66210 [Actinoplanes sp. NBRC 101535]
MPSAGETLGGRYHLDDRIASGGMGEVWRATDTVLGRSVAVKTLLARHAGEERFRSRFEHEARVMASLRHQGIAPVYDYGTTDDGAYLVMAHVDGEPLDRRLDRVGRLEPVETMAVVAQAARALAVAHRAGIVHRDVKPGNLIVEPDGTVVLVDFGVARSARSLTLTGTDHVVGTVVYIAPEQVAKREVTPAADLYSLGVVAYHCLAGQPPFFGDNPVAIAVQHFQEEPPPLPDDVPRPVRDVVMRALAKEPEQRWPSAAAMAEAAAVAGAPSTEALRALRVPPKKRNRRAAALIVGGVIVFAGGGAGLVFADPFGIMPGVLPSPSAPMSVSPTPSPTPRPSQSSATPSRTVVEQEKTTTRNRPRTNRPPDPGDDDEPTSPSDSSSESEPDPEPDDGGSGSAPDEPDEPEGSAG